MEMTVINSLSVWAAYKALEKLTMFACANNLEAHGAIMADGACVEFSVCIENEVGVSKKYGFSISLLESADAIEDWCDATTDRVNSLLNLYTQ